MAKTSFSKGFAKLEMMKRSVSENLDVYDLLGERTGNVNPRGLYKIEEEMNGLMEGSIKDAKRQEKQYIKAKSKMYVLRLIQIKRRKKLLEWFENYISKIEDNENNKLIRKHAFGLDREYKDEIRNSFLDDFEDYASIIEVLKNICDYVEAITEEEPSDTCTVEDEQAQEEKTTEEPTEEESSGTIEGEQAQEEEGAEEPTEEESSGTIEGANGEQESGAEAGVSALSAEGDGSEEPTPQRNAEKKKSKLGAFLAEGEDCEEEKEVDGEC